MKLFETNYWYLTIYGWSFYSFKVVKYFENGKFWTILLWRLSLSHPLAMNIKDGRKLFEASYNYTIFSIILLRAHKLAHTYNTQSVGVDYSNRCNYIERRLIPTKWKTSMADCERNLFDLNRAKIIIIIFFQLDKTNRGIL